MVEGARDGGGTGGRGVWKCGGVVTALVVDAACGGVVVTAVVVLSLPLARRVTVWSW